MRDQYVESFFSRQFVQCRKWDSVEKRSNSFEGFRREGIVKSTLQHFPGSPSSLPILLVSMLHNITRVLCTINSTVMRNFYNMDPNKANLINMSKNVLVTYSYSIKLNNTIVWEKKIVMVLSSLPFYLLILSFHKLTPEAPTYIEHLFIRRFSLSFYARIRSSHDCINRVKIILLSFRGEVPIWRLLTYVISKRSWDLVTQESFSWTNIFYANLM